MAIERLGATLRQIKRLWADGTIMGCSDAQLLERYIAGHDDAAFEALVAHHGPMVLGVCRGVLNDPNDAEDAFQATFLILVKKSTTLRRREALGPWLYQVAHRVAIRSNAIAARRRACERRAGQMAATTTASGPSALDEPLQALHQEIARLPERLRRAIILCDLQSLPQNRAAGELRLSERTLQRRLNEGRRRLKDRLIRRGLAPEGAVLGSAFLRQACIAVPPAWGRATVRAALATASQSVNVGIISAGASKLAREVLRIMLLQKLTLASAILVAAGLITWGASAALVGLDQEPSQNVADRPSPPLQQNAETAVARPERNEPDPPGKITIRGRVLAPDGRPVSGAKLYMTTAWGYPHEPSPSPEYGTTGPDGRFRFAVPEAEFEGNFTVVAAAAPNYGAGWVKVHPDDQRDELTIRLVEDDVPINGQIIDLEGKPIPGAALSLMQINAAPEEDLGPWLEAVKAKRDIRLELEQRYLTRFTLAVPLQVTTDSAGRFRLRGIGRNRLVAAQLEGPTIVTEQLLMLTRPGETIEVRHSQPGGVDRYYGANFRHAAAPSKPIIGVVRDADTKAPLAGVTVRSLALTIQPHMFEDFDRVRTTTDAQGRYRLTGMPKRDGNLILAMPGADWPYVFAHKEVPSSPGLGPVTADIELKRGVWIEGKITNKLTGEPLRGPRVSYFALLSNPNLRDYPGFDETFVLFEGVETKADGSYRLVGLPGPGLVAVWHYANYRRAPDREDEFGTKESSLNTAPYTLGIDSPPNTPSNLAALARINPSKGVDSVKQDVKLDPGSRIKVTGTVVGPDGQPLPGARTFGLDGQNFWHHKGMKTAEFEGSFVSGQPLDPPVLFQHLEKGLVGVAEAPKGKSGSITVRMEPGATVTGRLVGADGRPRRGVELRVTFHPWGSGKGWASWFDYSPGRIKTDQEGRFRIEALLPGYEFNLYDNRGELPFGGDGLRSAETKDLSDVQLKDLY
jgi:RNA polymerase sigma factor (sigma-70 family)